MIFALWTSDIEWRFLIPECKDLRFMTLDYFIVYCLILTQTAEGSPKDKHKFINICIFKKLWNYVHIKIYQNQYETMILFNHESRAKVLQRLFWPELNRIFEMANFLSTDIREP